MHHGEWEDPRVTLQRHGHSARKRFSQNFLVQPQTVHQIISALQVSSSDTVVEVGPGTGALTRVLLPQVSCVHVVEKDPDMTQLLQSDLQASIDLNRLVVHHADILEFDLSSIQVSAAPGEMNQASLKVVGNIPYAITGPILKWLTDGFEKIDRAVLMVQYEVGQRLTAQPGSKPWGALSCWVGLRYGIRRERIVAAGNFHPKPKVDSMVVSLSPLRPPRDVPKSFATLVQAGFNARRKTLRNALGKIVPKDTARDKLFAEANIDPMRRGETLSIEEWLQLAGVFDALALSW